MKLLYSIIDQVLNSEITEKIAGIGGGATAGVITFVSSEFGDFAIKCVTAVIFATLGGLFGYAGKKLGEYFFNKYKNRKNANGNEKLSS